MHAQPLVNVVMDRKMVGRKAISVIDRRLLSIGQVIGLRCILQRAHQILGNTIDNSVSIAYGHTATTLIVERNPKAHQFNEPLRQGSTLDLTEINDYSR